MLLSKTFQRAARCAPTALLVLAIADSTWTGHQSSNAFAQATPSKPSIQNDPAYKQFIGNDGSQFYGADPAFATDVVSAVVGYPGISYTLPAKDAGKPRCCVEIERASLIAGDSFEQLMIAAVDPDEQSKNPYVAIVAGYMNQLEQRILASQGGLTPADIVRMSLDLSHGNYPTAVLLAHNYLKNIAYKGRQAVTKFAPMIAQGKNPNIFKFPPNLGLVASKLVNMRAAAGDKMGIWYHSFVPLAIAAWTCQEGSADQAITEEYRVRRLGKLTNMASPIDPEKQTSDERFAAASHAIFKERDGKPTILVCEAQVVPAKASLDTEFRLKLTYQIAGIGVSATALLEEDLKVTAKDYTHEVRKQNREVVIADKRTVVLEMPFKPEKEGKHEFVYALLGPRGFVNTNGSLSFEVSAEELWRKAIGLWKRSDSERRIRIYESGGELVGTWDAIGDMAGYQVERGDFAFDKGRPTNPRGNEIKGRYFSYLGDDYSGEKVSHTSCTITVAESGNRFELDSESRVFDLSESTAKASTNTTSARSTYIRVGD